LSTSTNPEPIDVGWVVEELRMVAHENADCGALEPALMARESPEYAGAWLIVQWWRYLVEAAPRDTKAAAMLSLIKGEITEDDWPEGADDRRAPDLSIFGL